MDSPRLTQLAASVGAPVDFDAEFGRPWAEVWLARADPDGGAVAFLVTWRVADEIHVIDIASDPRFRRRGAARALLVAAIGCARAGRARLLVLEVRASNHPAIALYRSEGFEVARVRRDYYTDPCEDALEMLLVLPGHSTVTSRSDSSY